MSKGNHTDYIGGLSKLGRRIVVAPDAVHDYRRGSGLHPRGCWQCGHAKTDAIHSRHKEKSPITQSKCVDCGTPVSRYAKRCIACNNAGIKRAWARSDNIHALRSASEGFTANTGPASPSGPSVDESTRLAVGSVDGEPFAGARSSSTPAHGSGRP